MKAVRMTSVVAAFLDDYWIELEAAVNWKELVAVLDAE